MRAYFGLTNMMKKVIVRCCVFPLYHFSCLKLPVFFERDVFTFSSYHSYLFYIYIYIKQIYIYICLYIDAAPPKNQGNREARSAIYATAAAPIFDHVFLALASGVPVSNCFNGLLRALTKNSLEDRMSKFHLVKK